MRKAVLAGLVMALALGGCTRSGGAIFGHKGPDEFAVARRAPLVVPPDFALSPPSPGAPRPQEADSSTQALTAMFGGTAQRSQGETAALTQAGADSADPGIRSAVADPKTNAVDKGQATRDIIAAPEGDGQDARTAIGAAPAAAAAPAAPAPTPSPSPNN